MSLITQAKKLVLVFATFALTIEVNMRVKDKQLKRFQSIQYLVKFKKSHIKDQSSIDSSSKVNAMTLVYATVLKLRICLTDVEVQKIHRFTLLIHGIGLANFQLEDKQEKMWFFQEIFLMANTAIEVVLSMPFLALIKAKIDFADRELN